MKLVPTEKLKLVDPTAKIETMLLCGWTDQSLIAEGWAELVNEESTPDERIATDFGVDVPHLIRVEKLASELVEAADDYNAAVARCNAARDALKAELHGAAAGVQRDVVERITIATCGIDQTGSIPADR